MSSQVNPIKCRIIRNDDGGPTRVDVYDDIGSVDWNGNGLTAKGFAAQMGKVKGAIEVHINSGGGDVFDGIAIGNAIRKHKGAVTTVVDGIAASIASVIAQAGQDRVMQPGSMMMIHDASTLCWGDEAEMVKTAAVLSKNSDNIAQIYAERSGGTPAQWRDIMKQETWYTADEAVAAGLADRVGDGDAELPAGMDIAAFSAVPGRIAARLRTMPQAQAKGPVIVGADGNHAPMTGSHAHGHPAYNSQGGDASHSHDHSHGGTDGPDANHRHSHAAADGDGTTDHAGHISGEMEPGACCSMCGPDCACSGQPTNRLTDAEKSMAEQHGHPGSPCVDPDGDGDCDAAPGGDTDHDYWTADGKPVKPLPKQSADRLDADAIWDIVRQMLRDAADGVDNSPWDGPKAMANGAASDDPAAFYAGICAGQKSGDKSTQDAWALPYKYHPGDAPNAAGVKAALGRLPQTEGLTNASEAKSKLQGLMKKINPDYEPDDNEHLDISGIDLGAIRAALKGAHE
jgi:ATP-dependent protease ClpP protease subunit